jgi:hypothetical protein
MYVGTLLKRLNNNGPTFELTWLLNKYPTLAGLVFLKLGMNMEMTCDIGPPQKYWFQDCFDQRYSPKADSDLFY